MRSNIIVGGNRTRIHGDQLVRSDKDDANWHLACDLPSGRVSQPLRLALQCAYADDDCRAKVFFERAVQNADRLIAEKRYLDTKVAESGHPRNLAEILCGRAYACWLLGARLGRCDIRRAAEHFVTWCRTKAEDRRSFNDSLTMSYYLAGVRAAMIACDLDYASELLRANDRLRWHHAREFDLWRRLVAMYPEVTDEFDTEFEIFFDVVRDPDFGDADDIGRVFIRRIWVALETGIIREMYIVNASPHDDPDPKAVVTAVAR
jgi:hypothetical protein